MTKRVRHPNTPAKDVDLGPGIGRVRSWDIIRRTLDVAIAKPLPHADPCVLWQPQR